MGIRSAMTFLGYVALAIGAGLAASSVFTMLGAVETTATVTEVAAENVRCKRSVSRNAFSRARRRDGCTRFTAQARFATNDRNYAIALPAGVFYGRDRPLGEAELHVSQRVRVVYPKSGPADAQRRKAFIGASLSRCLLVSFLGFAFLGMGHRGRDA